MQQEHAKFELLGADSKELSELVEKLGGPAYRSKQLFEALYRQRVGALDDVSTLPKEMREKMAAAGYGVGLPAVEKRFVSSDGTVRYLFKFADGESVEAVWMPEGDGGEAGDGSEAGLEEEGTLSGKRDWKRATICISSQIGCAVNCQFCLTALLGQKRNLTAGEIVGQVNSVLNDHKVDLKTERINLVFMGQGEPFLNYDNVMKAVRLLSESGVGVPVSRMTISTSGIVPRIYDFAKEEVRPKLAVSLNAPNDMVREQVMPINRKWNIEALLKAAREFPLRNREKLTFEYVLLGGVNDSPAQARELAELLRGTGAKINLIAWNPGPEVPYATPTDEAVDTFKMTLREAGIPAFVRRPRGRDIFAACGQLKRTESLTGIEGVSL
jgi:23S rRNA (adenine2503-C2)-methyltransferase